MATAELHREALAQGVLEYRNSERHYKISVPRYRFGSGEPISVLGAC